MSEKAPRSRDSSPIRKESPEKHTHCLCCGWGLQTCQNCARCNKRFCKRCLIKRSPERLCTLCYTEMHPRTKTLLGAMRCCQNANWSTPQNPCDRLIAYLQPITSAMGVDSVSEGEIKFETNGHIVLVLDDEHVAENFRCHDSPDQEKLDFALNPFMDRRLRALKALFKKENEQTSLEFDKSENLLYTYCKGEKYDISHADLDRVLIE